MLQNETYVENIGSNAEGGVARIGRYVVTGTATY
jgi:hypothetical protein